MVARDSNEAGLRRMSITGNFAPTLKGDNLLRQTLSDSLNHGVGLTLDLQRYTYSQLTLSLRFILNVTEFLSLTMGTNSQNNEMFRYFRDWPFFPGCAGQKPKSSKKTDNFFEEFPNSYRCNNDKLRTNSGFKPKSFNFQTTHHLGDWDGILSIKIAP
jgi:hypothetical protein